MQLYVSSLGSAFNPVATTDTFRSRSNTDVSQLYASSSDFGLIRAPGATFRKLSDSGGQKVSDRCQGSESAWSIHGTKATRRELVVEVDEVQTL